MSVVKGIEALKKALEFEESGADYYAMAKEKTRQPQARSIFVLLEEEEKAHIEFLQKMYNKLSAADKWPSQITIDIEKDFKMIFDEAAKNIDSDVKVATDEVEVLSKAIDIERRGRAMYYDLSEKAEDENEKRLYTTLAKWEEGHVALLEDFYNFFSDHGMFTGE